MARIFRNASYLLSGDLVASGMRMVSIALTARALGVESFGILVLLQTYVAVIDRVLNFQSWQALIKYGAEHRSQEREHGLEDLFKLGFLVDFITAILGAGIAALAATLVGTWLNWEASIIEYAVFYSAVIAFNIEGTCIAILRLHDKFGLIGAQKVIAAAVKLIATAIAFATTDSLVVFVTVAAVCQVVGYLVLLALAFRQLALLRLAPLRKGEARRAFRENKGITTYIVSTNLHSTFRIIPDQLDFIIVAAVLGNAATGSYKVAKEMARILTRVVQPLYQSIYPELAALAANRKYRQILQIVWRSGFVVGLAAIFFWVCLILFGESLLALIFGDQYTDAYMVMIWYALGAVISAAAFPITPAILAVGYPKLPLVLIVFSTIIYVVCLPIMMNEFGLPGAGMANVVFYGSWVLLMGIGVKLVFSGNNRMHD